MRLFIALFVLAGVLISPATSWAVCFSDPIRDAAFADRSEEGCRSRFEITIPLEQGPAPRTTITFHAEREDIEDRVPPWLYVDSVNRPNHPDPPERIDGLGGGRMRGQIGFTYRQQLP